MSRTFLDLDPPPPGPGAGTPEIRPRRAGIELPGKEKDEGSTDLSQDRQAEVGYHFGNPQGVQVVSLNSRSWRSPPPR